MAQVYTPYSAGRVVIVWGGYSIQGFAEDNFVTVTMAEDYTTTTYGADGGVGTAVSAVQSGTIEINLAQGAVTNNILAGIAAEQRKDLTLFKATMLIYDPSAQMIMAKMEGVHLTSEPDVSLGKEANQERTWSFHADRVDLTPVSAIPDGEALLSQVDQEVLDAVNNLQNLIP